jgi:hypothetical protein
MPLNYVELLHADGRMQHETEEQREANRLSRNTETHKKEITIL